MRIIVLLRVLWLSLKGEERLLLLLSVELWVVGRMSIRCSFFGFGHTVLLCILLLVWRLLINVEKNIVGVASRENILVAEKRRHVEWLGLKGNCAVEVLHPECVDMGYSWRENGRTLPRPARESLVSVNVKKCL